MTGQNTIVAGRAKYRYCYAQACGAAGVPEQAVKAAVRYLQLRGREAEYYTTGIPCRCPRPAAGREAAVVRTGTENRWLCQLLAGRTCNEYRK